MASLRQRLRGLALSAVELQELTEWPWALIEDYLNINDNITTISSTVDTGLSLGITNVSGDYTTTDSDGTILIDCSANAVTITLDVTATEGQTHTLKCIDDTFTCLVDAGANAIDNDGSTFQLYKDESIAVKADENNDWWVI